MHEASSRGHTEVARVLLNYGANVNIRANCGTTPLIDACDSGQVSIVKLLLGAGADPLAQNNEAKTPQSAATTEEVRHLIQQFIDAANCPEQKRALVDGSGNEDEEKSIILEKVNAHSSLPTCFDSSSNSKFSLPLPPPPSYGRLTLNTATSTTNTFSPITVSSSQTTNNSNKLGITSISELKSVIHIIPNTNTNSNSNIHPFVGGK